MQKSLVIAGCVVLWELILMLLRKQRARQVFQQAEARAKATGKKLLVVGDPRASLKNRLFGTDYGCGDQCVDLNGCGVCPSKSVSKDLVTHLNTLSTSSLVVFESCTLEYVPDRAEAEAELLRVSGGDVFSVRVSPLSLFYWTRGLGLFRGSI